MSHLNYKKNKIYGNNKVYSPDGKLMFRCSDKKAKWYINRNLATVNDNEVYLNFEPKGYGHHNMKYGLFEMKNRCVVCGETNKLTRHHVVPHMYRKHFPLHLKDRNFHDILAMCIPCHEIYEEKANKYKNYLFNYYEIDKDEKLSKEFILVNKINKIATALFYFSKSIPNNRILELKHELRKLTGIKRITKERLEKYSKISKRDSKDYSKLLVSKIDNIEEFIISWRKHFIENNNCKHLPENWSVFYKKD